MAVVWIVGLILVCSAVTALADGVVSGVTISESKDEGVDCFKIVTPSATYFYDKAGAGFTSIVDKDGNDWIGWRPGGKQDGEYRGIPNMGLNQFGHPGYAGATTTTADKLGVELPKVTLRSSKQEWSVTWEFFPNYARLTVHSVGENYWFLYEGTPGGKLDVADFIWRCDGTKTDIREKWHGDLVNKSGAANGSEWVAFADSKADRSLFLMHQDDEVQDSYYRMGSMTVFGFGRKPGSIERLLSRTPTVLVIGLAETREFGALKAHVDRVWEAAEAEPAPAQPKPAAAPGKPSS